MIRIEFSNSISAPYVTQTIDSLSVGFLPVAGDEVIIGNMAQPAKILKRTIVMQQANEILIKYWTS